MRQNCWAWTAVWLALSGWILAASPGNAESPQAKSPFIVEHVPEEWLPQSSVIAITQTHDGYLWLGTLNGLVRFDGIRCTVFTEAKIPALKSSQIVYLYEDNVSNLWVGTQTAGIALIRKDGSVRHLDIDPAHTAGPLESVCEDPRGGLWLNTADGQIARYLTNEMKVMGARARPIAMEKSGRLWLGAGQQMLGLTMVSNNDTFFMDRELPVHKLDFLLADRKDGVWRLADEHVQRWVDGHLDRDFGAYPWTNVQVSAACQDKEGNLIVGTQGAGVFWYDAQGRPTQISGAQGLSHGTVLSLCVDREGNLWVGTDGGGLNRVRRKLFSIQEGSEGLTIQSVSGDGQDGLWFANFGGKLNHWRNGTLKQFGVAEGLRDLNVRSVLADASNVWVGTTFWGIFTLQDGNFRQVLGKPGPGNPSVSALCRDRNGQLWAGTQGGLLRWDGHEWKVFTTRDGLSTNDVRAVVDDAKGNLFVGTGGGGLDCLREGRFKSLRETNGSSPSDTVSSLYVDREDVLWIGTPGNGLVRFDGSKWTHYTMRDGLLGNSIGYLIEDGRGYLWIGSYAGLMRIPKKALNDFAAGSIDTIPCRVFGRADGLPTRECTQGSQPAACRTPDGMLWFSSIKGLVSVNPSELKPNLYPPPVIIESVLIDGQEQNTNTLCSGGLQAITVPAHRERLEIQYTSLNLAAPDRARFRYRLEGHETDWTDADGARAARFSNLPPGRYRFHVVAANEDGVSNEIGAALAVTVLPPFWRTWWFLGVNAAVLLAGTILVVRYVSIQKLQRQLAVLRQQEALEKERARIARDLHDQLGANLTQVSILGEMAESDKHLPQEVEAHAQQISQTARETTRALDEIVWAVNPSNDTLEGLITYACKYAQDYCGMAGLSYRLAVPTQLPEIGIPPDLRHNVFLAFKEAVNNVVKHAQASETWVRLVLQDGSFIIEIQDNGRGGVVPDEKTGRNGLRNMRKRMEDVGGAFSIGPAPGGGTVVRLTVPVERSERD